MRNVLLFVTVTLAAPLFAAPSAWGHGGGSFRGPSGVAPPRPQLRCDCADAECPLCSEKGLATLQGVSVRRAETRTVTAWDDLVEVETRVRFETVRERGFVEGHATVAHAPLFAAVACAVEMGDQALEGRIVASAAARRDYLWERQRQRDPLLVLRRDAASVKLRVFPITRAQPTFAVVRGYALSDDVGSAGVRLYCTDARYLAVVPLKGLAADAEPDFVDPGGGRALFFLDAAEVLRRFGGALRHARDVPCVRALECAVRDHGVAAVTRHAALVAVPAGRGAPTDLIVGDGSPHDPSPPPPPPAPIAATAPAAVPATRSGS